MFLIIRTFFTFTVFALILTVSASAEAKRYRGRITFGGKDDTNDKPSAKKTITEYCPGYFSSQPTMTIMYEKVSIHDTKLLPNTGVSWEFEVMDPHASGAAWAPGYGAAEFSLNYQNFDNRHHLTPGILLRLQLPVTFNVNAGMYIRTTYAFDLGDDEYDRFLLATGVVIEINLTRKEKNMPKITCANSLVLFKNDLYVRLLVGIGREAYKYDRPAMNEVILGMGWRLKS